MTSGGAREKAGCSWWAGPGDGGEALKDERKWPGSEGGGGAAQGGRPPPPPPKPYGEGRVCVKGRPSLAGGLKRLLSKDPFTPTTKSLTHTHYWQWPVVPLLAPHLGIKKPGERGAFSLCPAPPSLPFPSHAHTHRYFCLLHEGVGRGASLQ